jgi:hypothetical protein
LAIRWQLLVVHAKTPFQSLIRKMMMGALVIRRTSTPNHEAADVEILSV